LVQISSAVQIPQFAFFEQPNLEASKDTIHVHIEDETRAGDRIKRIGKNFWYDLETEELTYTFPGLLRSFRASMKIGNDSVIRFNRSFYNASLSFQTRFGLYNLLNALLSIRLLLHGHKLQFGGCISKDGRGVLLPAFADVGKTTTVLKLVREGEAQYLSDDKTIVSPSGQALCLPTIVRPKKLRDDGVGWRVRTTKPAVDRLSERFRTVYPFGVMLPSAPRNPSAYTIGINPSSVLKRVQVSSICFLEWGGNDSREIGFHEALNRLWALDIYEPTWMSNTFVAAYGYARPDLDFGELLFKEAEITSKFTESVGRFHVLTRRGKDFSEPILAHLREGAGS
jgi:hypothetical protein